MTFIYLKIIQFLNVNITIWLNNFSQGHCSTLQFLQKLWGHLHSYQSWNTGEKNLGIPWINKSVPLNQVIIVPHLYPSSTALHRTIKNNKRLPFLYSPPPYSINVLCIYLVYFFLVCLFCRIIDWRRVWHIVLAIIC